MTRRPLFASIFALLALSQVAEGASFLVADDRELVARADAIGVATVLSSHPFFTDGGEIATESILRVDEPLKGALSAGETIIVTERGGEVGGLAMIVSGSPVYRGGERVLVFLEGGGEGWRTLALEMGKFSFVRDAEGRELLVRGAGEGEIFGWGVLGRRHQEPQRLAAPFLEFIRAAADGASSPADYFVEPAVAGAAVGTLAHVPGNDYLTQFSIGSTSRGARWPTDTFTFDRIGVQAGVANLDASIDTARNAWNADPGSTIEILRGGVGNGTYGENDGRNNIFFDQPNSGDLAGSTVGVATVWANNLLVTTPRGEQLFRIIDCDIIIERGLTGGLFEEVLAHEMGHCLGFRHSNSPYPGQTTITISALMNSSVTGAGAFLREWDREAANHVYGDGSAGAPCVEPSITQQPQGTTIFSGQTATLSVGASGTEPLTHQWFRGGSPATGTAIVGATSSTFVTGPLTASEVYSVLVSNACGEAESSIATVTVSPSAPTGRRRPVRHP